MTTSSCFVQPSPRLVTSYRQLASTPTSLRQPTYFATLSFLSGELTKGDLKKFALFLTEQYEYTPDSSISTRAIRFLEVYLRVLCHSYEFHLRTYSITASSSHLLKTIELAFGNLIPVHLFQLLLECFAEIVRLEIDNLLDFSEQEEHTHWIVPLPIPLPLVKLFPGHRLVISHVPINPPQNLYNPKEKLVLSPDLEKHHPLHRAHRSRNGQQKTQPTSTTTATTDHHLGTLSNFYKYCLSCDLSLCKNVKRPKKTRKTRVLKTPKKLKIGNCTKTHLPSRAAVQYSF